MVDSCYICRRTQVDLDRLNEEIRARVYLSYFSNARSQLEEQQRNIGFLQRLKDEESGNAHFRSSAKQVFQDPTAYAKLMPWIETLIGIAQAHELPADDQQTMGALVDELLAMEHHLIFQMEQSVSQIRSGFASAGRSPLSLEMVTHTFPVEWSIKGIPFTWHPSQASDREPLRRRPGETTATVEVPLHICSVCRKLTAGPQLVAPS